MVYRKVGRGERRSIGGLVIDGGGGAGERSMLFSCGGQPVSQQRWLNPVRLSRPNYGDVDFTSFFSYQREMTPNNNVLCYG